MRDLLVDRAGDLQLQAGDLVVGESSLQHQWQLLITQKGSYKDMPELGVGIANYVNLSNKQAALIEVKRNLEYDGLTVESLKWDLDGKLYVDAKYT